MNIPRPSLKFSEEESDQAYAYWKASCGPHSIAAALGLTLEQVRPALTNFKGWMNPTQMSQALVGLKVPHNLKRGLKTAELCEGISRIQWEGPWLNPGVPARVAYHHTHWVAHTRGWVLCTACVPSLWVSVEDWRYSHLKVPPIMPFHITHHYEFPVTPEGRP